MFRCNKFLYPSQYVRIIPHGVKTDNSKDTDITISGYGMYFFDNIQKMI